MSNSYCTLSQVKTALAIKTTDDDWFLDDLMTQAQDMVDQYIGYSFQSVTETRKFNGRGRLTLYTGPISTVTQVLQTTLALNGITVATDDITTDCLIDSGVTLVRASGTEFASGVQNYTVTATYGYSAVPASISRATIRLVVHWYKMRDTNYSSMAATPQFGTDLYMQAIPPDVLAILAQFRRVNFGGGFY